MLRACGEKGEDGPREGLCDGICTLCSIHRERGRSRERRCLADVLIARRERGKGSATGSWSKWFRLTKNDQCGTGLHLLYLNDKQSA